MKYVLLIIPGVSRICEAQTGIITTIAGNGSSSYSGDGGPATAAGVTNPAAMGCFDQSGNYIFCVRYSHRVRKISRSGIITTIAGTGTRGYSGDGGLATAAMLNNPRTIAVDSSNNIYIGETEGSRVRKINASSGIITTYAGNGMMADSCDGIPATAAAFQGALGIAFDRWQNLFIVDGSSRIRKVDGSTRIVTNYAGIPSTGGFYGDGGPATAAEFNGANGLCTDTLGNLYVADFGNARIRKIDRSTGIVTTVVGSGGSGAYNGEGVTATAAQITPAGVRIDKRGELFIADLNNHRIRKVNSAGFVYTVVGTGVAGFSGDGGRPDSAKIYSTFEVDFDDCDDFAFCEHVYNRIRKVSYGNNPTITISSSTSSNLCYPMPVTFTAHATYTGSLPTYQWKVNGVNVGTSTPSYSYTPASGDSIQCLLTSSLYCVINPMDTSNTIHLTVGSMTPPTVAVTGDSIRAAGTAVNLTASITGASGSYLLRWRNHGVEFTTTAAPPVSYTKPVGTDTITVAMISTNRGCYDSAVSAGHLVWDHNVAVGSLQSAIGSLSVYPNPVGDELFIEATEPITGIHIVDVLGREIDMPDKGTSGRNLRMDVSHLSPGIYFVKVVCKDGEVAKVIVKK